MIFFSKDARERIFDIEANNIRDTEQFLVKLQLIDALSYQSKQILGLEVYEMIIRRIDYEDRIAVNLILIRQREADIKSRIFIHDALRKDLVSVKRDAVYDTLAVIYEVTLKLVIILAISAKEAGGYPRDLPELLL